MKTPIHSSDKHLLSSYYVPGIVPGVGEKVEKYQLPCTLTVQQGWASSCRTVLAEITVVFDQRRG